MRPIITNMSSTIQNRTTTLPSVHPHNSKWWWIGAILNTRLCVILKYPTWMMSLSVETPFLSFDFAGRFLAIVLFVIWVNFLMAAWTNAVNLTDGLDGLCAGSSMVAFAGYGIIAFWESYHLRGSGQ